MFLFWTAFFPLQAVREWASWADDRSDDSRHYTYAIVLGALASLAFLYGAIVRVCMGTSNLATLGIALVLFIAYPYIIRGFMKMGDTFFDPHPRDPDE